MATKAELLIDIDDLQQIIDEKKVFITKLEDKSNQALAQRNLARIEVKRLNACNSSQIEMIEERNERIRLGTIENKKLIKDRQELRIKASNWDDAVKKKKTIESLVSANESLQNSKIKILEENEELRFSLRHANNSKDGLIENKLIMIKDLTDQRREIDTLNIMKGKIKKDLKIAQEIQDDAEDIIKNLKKSIKHLTKAVIF